MQEYIVPVIKEIKLDSVKWRMQ